MINRMSRLSVSTVALAYPHSLQRTPSRVRSTTRGAGGVDGLEAVVIPQVSVSLPDWQAGEGQVENERAATSPVFREKNSPRGENPGFPLVLAFSLRGTDGRPAFRSSHAASLWHRKNGSGGTSQSEASPHNASSRSCATRQPSRAACGRALGRRPLLPPPPDAGRRPARP